jgi:hypothetical protein
MNGNAESLQFKARARRFPTHALTTPSEGVWSFQTLKEMVGDSVRQVRRSARGLTPRDRDLLKSFKDGQYLTGVMRFMEIGQKCEDVADATAFPEAIRGFTVKYHPRAHVCIGEAFRNETDANGIANLAQHDYWLDPSEANRQRAIEALNRQLAETYRALNALHRPAAKG